MDSINNSNREQSSFWQFSDQLRLHAASLAGLSIGDSIWSNSSVDNNNNNSSIANSNPDSTWKMGLGTSKLAFGYGSNFERSNNTNNNNSTNNNNNSSFATNQNNSNNHHNNNNSNNIFGGSKNYLSNGGGGFSKAVSKPAMGLHGNSRRNSNNNNDGVGIGKKKALAGGNGNGKAGSNDNNNGAVDKRFKTLPPSEALPRTEAVGGYIFVCNNDTMQENLKRQLFGLPPRYRDSVRAITPGLPLFLYNYSTHQLHGIFEAASFGGSNIDPTAWEDKKSHGESRFPAQVKVVTRKICGPLEEDSFRPILHHYDGPKFRLELSVPEALALLDIFAENNA
ncbi:B2 protein-like [Iris pallida]|uniref:B2 protein-like n=1 Tax=Iris pallida TaxID=29817 RepID=A0AAX6DKR0_IRIPA|nr:B2 protein-like [Iris pallida]